MQDNIPTSARQALSNLQDYREAERIGNYVRKVARQIEDAKAETEKIIYRLKDGSR